MLISLRTIFTSFQLLHYLVLETKLEMLTCLLRFLYRIYDKYGRQYEFNSDEFTSVFIGAKVDFTERAAAELFAEDVLAAANVYFLCHS